MAFTTSNDMEIPIIFTIYGSVNKIPKDIYVQSGVVMTSPVLNQKVANGGQFVNIPYFNALGAGNATIGDTSANLLVSQKHSASKDVAYIVPLARSWSAMDLASELAGVNIVNDIYKKVQGTWTTQRQNRIVASVQGLVADSIANHSSDLVESILETDPDTAATSANFVTVAKINAALGKMGDRRNELTMIAMHSTVYGNLVNAGLIAYQRDTDYNEFGKILGRTIVIDDGLANFEYGNEGNVQYQTVLYGQGAFSMAAGQTSLIPTEFYRNPMSGYGSGQDTLISRRNYIIHPNGYAYNTAVSPTIDNLKLATTWTRAVNERKLIKMSVIRSNG